jgi:hypothetical protein
MCMMWKQARGCNDDDGKHTILFMARICDVWAEGIVRRKTKSEADVLQFSIDLTRKYTHTPREYSGTQYHVSQPYWAEERKGRRHKKIVCVSYFHSCHLLPLALHNERRMYIGTKRVDVVVVVVRGWIEQTSNDTRSQVKNANPFLLWKLIEMANEDAQGTKKGTR